MGAKARLPDNMQPAHVRNENDLIPRISADGTLLAFLKCFVDRLILYEMEIDHQKRFYICGEPISDNGLWCIFRRDIESRGGFGLKPQDVRILFNKQTSALRKRIRTEPGRRTRVDQEDFQG